MEEPALIQLPQAINLEYYVSPAYTKKYVKSSEVYERGDGSVGRTNYYDLDSCDQLIGWLENNNLAILRQTYPEAGHTDQTYLFAGQAGIVAVDTYYMESRNSFWESSKDKTYQHFVRIRSPRTMGMLPLELTQTLKVLGYEQQEPTDDFKKRCPLFFKQSKP